MRLLPSILFFALLCIIIFIPSGIAFTGNCEDSLDNDGDGYVDIDDVGCLDASDASEIAYGYQILKQELNMKEQMCLQELIDDGYGLNCFEDHIQLFSWFSAFSHPEVFSSCLDSYSSEYYGLTYTVSDPSTQIALADCVYDHNTEYSSQLKYFYEDIVGSYCLQVYYDSYSSACDGASEEYSCTSEDLANCIQGFTCGDDNSCLSSCINSDDCVEGYYCDQNSGTCSSLFDEGSSCISDSQCEDQLFCIDSFCGEKDSEFVFTEDTFSSGGSSSPCFFTVDGLALAQVDGDYVEECYVDIPFSLNDLSGKMIILDETRANFFIEGDFEDVQQEDIVLSNPISSISVEKNIGVLFSNAERSTNKPLIGEDSLGNVYATILRQGSLSQFFKVLYPGDEYKLDFTMDISSLGEKNGIDQLFYTSLSFYDENFDQLNFIHPSEDVEVSKISILSSYSLEKYPEKNGKISESFLFKTIDCEDHIKYTPGDATYDEEVRFNHCLSYDEEDIQYGLIEFLVNWDGSGSPILDDVVLDYPRSIEIEIFDSSGTLVQSSTEQSFYVEEFNGDGTLRLYLRSLHPLKTPLVKSLTIKDSQDLSVSIGSKLETFTEPRVGFAGGIPPTPEWADSFELQSLCLDPFNGNTPLNCLDFFTKYDASRYRANIPLSYIDTKLSGTTYSFAFREGNYDDKLDSETLLSHIAQAEESGMDILMIIDANCEGTYYWDKSYNCFWDMEGELNSEFDPTSSDDSDDVEQSIELMAQYTSWLASQFDGTHSYTFNDGIVVKLPKVRYWEIGVETNLANNGIQWYIDLTDEQEATYLSSIASEVKKIYPSAFIATNLNPYNTYIHQMFHYDYLENVLSQVDASFYTHFDFNAYNDGNEVKPEEFLVDYEYLKEKDYFSDWKDKTLGSGEHSYSQYIYDPACLDSWERGYGMESYTKLTARNMLVLLGSPFEYISDYNFFNGEGFARGQQDTCWRSDNYGMTQIFERVPGTGILEGISEPSVFELNDAGLAVFILSKHLSVSSPYSVFVEEGYAGAFLESNKGKKYLALWQVPSVKYTLDYMSYTSGYKDTGYEEKELVDVSLEGIDGVSSVTLIHLDGSSDEILSVKDNVIQGVLLEGDMPVLLSLEF